MHKKAAPGTEIWSTMTPADLKSARKRLGMTGTEFAKLLGVSPRHVRRMETPVGKTSHRPVPPRVELLLLRKGLAPRGSSTD